MPLCNSSDLEALMPWYVSSQQGARFCEPVESQRGAQRRLQINPDDDWNSCRGCGDNQMRVVSSDSALR